MRLLLINPRFPESFWSSKWALSEVLPNKRAVNPPLGLATLAALCPPDWEIEIVDENIEPIPLEPQADIVGICGMGVQFPRQKELLAYYRSRGTTCCRRKLRVLCPEHYTELPARLPPANPSTSGRILSRLRCKGRPSRCYHETARWPSPDSPTRASTLLKLPRYSTFRCDSRVAAPFSLSSDIIIIIMFGRKRA
jgi:hypothetical protein